MAVSESLATIGNELPATTSEALARILKVEQVVGAIEECRWVTEHVLHGGMYARTVRIAPNTLVIGALIKVPTVLIVNGDCLVLAGDRWHEMSGYQVIPAAAGRKQILAAKSATEVTMIFPTKAENIEDAEEEFTEEVQKLHSRRQSEGHTATQEVKLCQE